MSDVFESVWHSVATENTVRLPHVVHVFTFAEAEKLCVDLYTTLPVRHADVMCHFIRCVRDAFDDRRAAGAAVQWLRAMDDPLPPLYDTNKYVLDTWTACRAWCNGVPLPSPFALTLTVNETAATVRCTGHVDASNRFRGSLAFSCVAPARDGDVRVRVLDARGGDAAPLVDCTLRLAADSCVPMQDLSTDDIECVVHLRDTEVWVDGCVRLRNVPAQAVLLPV
jgi:hypothetical protein